MITGAHIDAISGIESTSHGQYMETMKQVQDQNGFGYIECNKYLPVDIKNDNQLFQMKFYVIWDLPYLLTRRPPISFQDT